jgi:Na+/melibiose symporter-like transporter
VGIVGFVLAWRLVPDLDTHAHTFDWVGVGLSAVAMFLIVFGLQEGEEYDWGQIIGIISVPLLIAVGLVVLAVFVWWQSRIRREPLVPLALFRDRNFSLANGGITLVSFAVIAMALPFMFWAQAVRGYTPTRAALLLVPMALVTGLLSPLVGRLVDSAHPRHVSAVGFGAGAAALAWLTQVMTPDSPVWAILLPMALFGVGNAFLWAPLAATATRNLPMASAGAGAGVYNTTRQVGAVLGSAAIAALMEARLSANLPSFSGSMEGAQTAGQKLPAEVAGPFADAMAQSVILPAVALGLGLIVAAMFARPAHATRAPAPVPAAEA